MDQDNTVSQASQNPRGQLVERLQAANNILVTVSTDPSVDQLAACIGLTLLLNKLGKHATAVFSGQVPSTIEFLEPENTLEKNTDSLRDFIIALDKSKADKLRYKVEDRVVKIFITPYRTSLSADDLEFSQGDFNVDVVVALGVKEQQDLDNAITAHGRILHDATVTTINLSPDGGLGSINWNDTQASSLCELVVDLTRDLGNELVDSQIATALLTGIVAETSRFSNERTTPQTMSVSAELMSAGANQQLIASKLEGPSVNLRSKGSKISSSKTAATPKPKDDKDEQSDDGMLEINHPKKGKPGAAKVAAAEDKTVDEPPESVETEPEANEPPPEPEPEEPNEPSVAETAPSSSADPVDSQPTDDTDKTPKLVTEPPQLGGTLTANSKPEPYDPSTDPLAMPQVESETPLLSRDTSPLSAPPLPEPAATPMPAPLATSPVANPSPLSSSAQPTPPPPHWTAPAWIPPQPAPTSAPPASLSPLSPSSTGGSYTLADIEQAVTNSSAGQTDNRPGLDTARSEVTDALNSVPPPPEAVQALNAQPVDLNPPTPEPVQPPAAVPSTDATGGPAVPAHPASTAFDPAAFEVINDPSVAAQPAPPTVPKVEMPSDPNAAPPLPPPLLPVPDDEKPKS